MRSWRNIKAVVMICIALGWWSVWFPEMAVWADAVRAVEQEGAEMFNGLSEEPLQTGLTWEQAEAIGRGFSQADREQIVIKSRLLMLLKEQWQERGEK